MNAILQLATDMGGVDYIFTANMTISHCIMRFVLEPDWPNFVKD